MTLANRLRALVRQVEKRERRLATCPTLADAIFLNLVDGFLSQIEVPGQKGAPGRKQIRTPQTLRGLERLVEECKKRTGCETDRAALEYLAERMMYGHTRAAKNRWVKTRRNWLSAHRNKA